jgi:hypothetical protein
MGSVRRRIILGVLALSLLAVGIFVRLNSQKTESPIDPLYAAGNYPIVVPALCEVRSTLANGKRTDAYNLFYRRAHGTLHALSADVDVLGDEGRALGGTLRKAKAQVEAGLLNPSMPLDAPLEELIDVTGDALTMVGADAPTAC